MKDNKKDMERLEVLLARNMAQITAKILVLSNKGGVGKSSVAVNIATCLSNREAKVGMLDADIHGPSVAKMLGFEGQKLAASGDGMFLPFKVKPNLTAVSMAMAIENSDAPVIWRGPLKMSVLRQFLAEVEWGRLDYLVIDSPPGTGDEPLSVCQMIKNMTGAIIVTTPQDIALLDSRKCVSFLRQLSVPIIGLLENMSGLTCPHCGKNIAIFKSGGGERAASELKVPFLGKIPFDPGIVEAADNGRPFVEAYPGSKQASLIEGICGLLDEKIRAVAKK